MEESREARMEWEKAKVRSRMTRIKDQDEEDEKLKAYEEFRHQVRRVLA